MQQNDKQEILTAIGSLANRMDEMESNTLEAIHDLAEGQDSHSRQIDGITQRVDGITQQIGGIKQQVSGITQQIGGITQRLTRIEATMVTKSYLDDKLADMKGDMVSLIRKEDGQVERLVKVLEHKKVLDAGDVRDVRSFRPFP